MNTGELGCKLHVQIWCFPTVLSAVWCVHLIKPLRRKMGDQKSSCFPIICRPNVIINTEHKADCLASKEQRLPWISVLMQAALSPTDPKIAGKTITPDKYNLFLWCHLSGLPDGNHCNKPVWYDLEQSTTERRARRGLITSVCWVGDLLPRAALYPDSWMLT